jgi:flavin reductase (DIM6/NTAB) family NADH-FMN oxidoreductase RutF
VGKRSRGLEDHFYSSSASRPDNLDSIPFTDGASGLPILGDSLAALECLVVAAHVAGDHTLFVARVEHVTLGRADSPLTSQDLDYVYVGEVIKRTGF